MGLLWAPLLLLAALPAAPATAAVVATVDRSEIELNESFTLHVNVDTALNREPDASVLEDDFHVLERSDVSNTMIVNGQISRSRTWSYVLMAKRTGELVIPPIAVGSERSRPVTVEVAPQAAALPGRSDIFVTAEVDHGETYVQSQVLYTVKVYRAVATRQPRLDEPELDGVDALLEIAGDEKSYESVIGGKTYHVVERAYALFPQASGDLNIAPVRFEARVLRDGRITGRKVFQSEPVSVAVKPIPPPPDSHPQAEWFPARSVELSEAWSRQPESLPAGEPITRHLTVTAVGQLSTQIPAIDVLQPDSVKIYPDKPELRVHVAPSGIVAARKDQYAMIGVEAGDVHLPALDLPWWSIDEEEWRIASLPARTIRILPAADDLPDAAVAMLPEAVSGAADSQVIHSTFWRNVSLALGAVWAGTLLLWWGTAGSRRRRTPRRGPQPPPVHRQQARLLKVARQAARAGNTAEVKAALLEWGRLQWPDRAPRALGDIATRVGEPLASELRTLGRVRYGPDGESWDGAALARALRSIPLSLPAGGKGRHDELPPLMPQT